MLGPKAVLAEGTAAAIEVIVAENPTFPWTSRAPSGAHRSLASIRQRISLRHHEIGAIVGEP
jgi:hypothetical protein